MKKKLAKWSLQGLEILFVLIIPLVIVFLGYGGWKDGAGGFKLAFGLVLSLTILYLIAKKIFLSPYLNKKRQKAASLSALLTAETDEGKIDKIKAEMRSISLIDSLSNWIPVLSFLLLGYMAASALEQGIANFAAILGFIAISELCGFVVSMIRTVKGD